jgi:molybdopterin converting factor subunit 1
VHVLLFSVLRENIGQPALQVDVPHPASVAALLEILEARYPPVASYRSVLRVAVNQAYAEEEAPLTAGDEVALITPVSGG